MDNIIKLLNNLYLFCVLYILCYNIYMNDTIPKIIHFIWVGNNPKPPLVLKCIESWKRILGNYEIKEWNEESLLKDGFDIKDNHFTNMCYKNKKWAFVSDYIRLYVLNKYGGTYLDTDMYIIKNIDNLLNYELILGKEDLENISAGFISNIANNKYINDLLRYYDNIKSLSELLPIPIIMTDVFKKNETEYDNYLILTKEYFYPFTADNIKDFNYHNAPTESYGVHLWNYSWGHPLNRFVKRIGLHKHLKKITEKLGIKNKIKKILKME